MYQCLLIIHTSFIVLKNIPPLTLILVVYIYVIHILFIKIILKFRLILLTVNTNLLFKPYHNIDTSIASLLFSTWSSGISGIVENKDSSSTGIFSTITTVSWFKDRFFLHPLRNLTKNLLLTKTPWTTPFNYFLILLELPSLNYSSNSPILAFTTVPYTILFPLTFNFRSVGRVA